MHDLRLRLGAVAIALAVTGCKQESPSSAEHTAARRPNFELVCRSSNTASAAELFCIRTDTRNGDVVRVRHMSLPTSNGPTAVAQPSAPGTYTTVCDATSTDTLAELYCIRLDTETGDMMLVNLQKVASTPPPP